MIKSLVIKCVSGFCLCLIVCSAWAVAKETKVPFSVIASNLQWKGVAVEEADYTIWGASPIWGEDGKVHLFVARWPEKNVDPAWRKSSEIAHYIADQPEGPFQFQEVVIRGTGKKGDWNRYAPHNPEIKKFGDTYAFLYIANSDYHQPPHPRNQYIGMLTSKSLKGPWKEVGKDGLILKSSDDPKHWTYGAQVVNPAIVTLNGKFYLYFKSKQRGVRGPQYGLAVSDKLEGPYKMMDDPITGKGITLEDASAFIWDGKVCLLTTDNHGHMTGIRGGGTLWVSADGKTFPKKWVQVGYDQMPAYYKTFDPTKAKRVYGNTPKMERPKVLMKDGKPAYLYGPSGYVLHGGQRTSCYVLKINLPDGATPLPVTSQLEQADEKVNIPTPTPAQLAWQEAELGVVFHYDLHLFDDARYNQHKNRRVAFPDPNIFNPTELDTDQWVRTAKSMGATFAIFTASHETGFRMWQSDASADYSLKAVKWGNGKRDIVKEFITSCKKYGLKPGIYMGTRWNSHHQFLDFKPTKNSKISIEQYNKQIEAEVTEICSRYGDLFELWFDGGAYGPKDGGPDILGIFEKYQKNCLFYHNYQRADARWGGSETGTVPYPCWARMPFADGYEGHKKESHANGRRLLKQGDINGKYWCPAMSDFPLRGHGGHEWFWEPGDERLIVPLKSLMNRYYKSVGRNSTLIVGLTPDKRGLMPDADVKRCQEWGAEIKRIFSNPIASTRGKGKSLELALVTPKQIDHVVIQEDIRHGERVREYVLEYKQGDTWVELAKGTCIGHKRIHQFKPIQMQVVRLRITQSVAEPILSNLSVYYAENKPSE